MAHFYRHHPLLPQHASQQSAGADSTAKVGSDNMHAVMSVISEHNLNAPVQLGDSLIFSHRQILLLWQDNAPQDNNYRPAMPGLRTLHACERRPWSALASTLSSL